MASATSAASPAASQAGDETYVDGKGFREMLQQLVLQHQALIALRNALNAAGKGGYLVFPIPDGKALEFTRKDLRAAESAFSKSILALRKPFESASKRRPRKATNPELLSGTYRPVYAGAALQQFFNAGAAGFGFVNPLAAAQDGAAAGQGALMEMLPRAKEGFLLRNTITMLFYIYAHQNNLQDVVDPKTGQVNAQYARSDAVMNAAFGGQIPAAFYSTVGDDGKTYKVEMNQAVEQGLIPEGRPLNTYEVVSRAHHGGQKVDKKGQLKDVEAFDPERYKTYFFQNLAAANYYSKENLAEGAPQRQRLLDDATRREMYAEHQLVKQASNYWTALLEPGRKAQRDARKKQADAAKRAQKAAAAAAQ